MDVGEPADARDSRETRRGALAGLQLRQQDDAVVQAVRVVTQVSHRGGFGSLVGDSEEVSRLLAHCDSRGVRHLDDQTKQTYQPDEATMQRLRAVVDGLPATIEKPNLDGLQLYRPGSSQENPYGYKGQIALREQFVMTGEVRQLLEHPAHVLSTQEIEAAAVASGMRTMLQDGILKAIAGETTLEEIYRVVG